MTPKLQTPELPLKDRIALVTGASRGIGRAAALALAAAGAHVVALARTQGALEELDDEIGAQGGTATLVPLDLKDYAGIDRLGAGLFGRFGRLDILVGNAAILGPLTPIGHIDLASWDQLLAVNLTANWRLIRSMDPLLRQSNAGRAIFVTSGAARTSKAYWGGYAITKSALDQMVKTYAAETIKTKVTANLLDPGPVATAMRTKAMPGEDPATIPAPQDIAPQFVAMSRPDFTTSGATFALGNGTWQKI
ncbi:Oxidoreductase, short-chain dehydrogenase/reductase family [hydrothermal vent metagenome]|uniref:Oxidoreductase, short-chain dehydrogenase/reductase family n=1 Tax=hydrothermal vent metagenome TaxID=652676 RepID=A0A3B0TJ93_9ZZZZ